MSASGARVARLGFWMKHLTHYFRDPDGRFESLGIQMKLLDKFRDMECIFLYFVMWRMLCIDRLASLEVYYSMQLVVYYNNYYYGRKRQF